MIQVHDLTKSFNNRKILNGINLTIADSASLVILGRSGSGKSVLIKNMIGLIEPDNGKVVFDKVNIFTLQGSQRFSLVQRCGFLFQHGALFDSLTVFENIVFYMNHKLESCAQKLNMRRKREVAAAKLKQVGLSPDILDFYPSELSGGMQKRVALARAICNDPSIIFFDEPTTGLDPIMSNIINETIIKIREELGATTITITHDINSAKMISTEIALLHAGKILWTGNKDNLEQSGNPIVDQFVKGYVVGPIDLLS